MGRSSFAVALVLGCAGCLTLAPVEAAPSYRFCAEYPDRGDVTCAYDTFAQCLATAGGGAGGSCRENPYYRPPVAPAVRKAKRRPE